MRASSVLPVAPYTSAVPYSRNPAASEPRTKYFSADLPTDGANLYDGLNFDKVAPKAELLMELFANGTYDQILLVYNKFKNAAVQVLTEEQYLPVAPPKAAASVKTATSKVDYIMEPSREEIVENIIPKSLKIQLYKALLDSNAAEHGARMTAMHKATDNADSLLKGLKLMASS